MTSDSRREIATYIKGEGITLDEFLKVYKYVPLNHGGWVSSLSRLIMEQSAQKERRSVEITPLGEIGNVKNSGIQLRKRFGKLADELISHEMSEIDEPVTTDTHRLIRYPRSLHGKTGFMVKEVSHDELENFEPLEKCIPDSFLHGEEIVSVNESFRIKLLGNRFEFQKSKVKMPLYAALYTVLSGRGQFISDIY